jgi:hypothetical protein
MDFNFQTPMIIMAQTTDDSSNYNSAPYLYFYNIPFLLNNSEIYLNNNLVNIILPLNSNQFFNKELSTLFDNEILLINLDHLKLMQYLSDQFDSIYSQVQYNSIITTLETTKELILNFNTNFLTDNTLYGTTTQYILSNMIKINNYDLINYNNDNFSVFNKFAIDIYGNNTNIIASNNIQGLKVNIYNYPIESYLANRKISANLIDYLNYIPTYFKNQINYVSKNNDYDLLTNINQYEEMYTSIGNINSFIQNTTFDYDNYYNVELLYPLDNKNFNSIYLNGNKIDISNVVNKYNLVSSNFDQIINNDNQYETEIIYQEIKNFDNFKFNYLGPIRYDGTIRFENTIDTTNYSHIKLDNGSYYKLSIVEHITNSLLNSNIVFVNSYLYNFVDISNCNTFIKTPALLYHYILQVDIGNNLIGNLGNCLYLNGVIYFFEVIDFINNIIQILSINIFNEIINEYFIGFLSISSLNDILNSTYNDITQPEYILFNKLTILELNKFNYYSNDSYIYNNFLIGTIFNPVIRQINNYFFLYYNSSTSPITLYSKNYNFIKIPPFSFSNGQLYSNNSNRDIYIQKSGNSLLKLNDYIISLNDLSNNMFVPDNYILSILPLSNPNLISYNISGILLINNSQVIIKFNNIINMPLMSYYSINNTYIYITTLSSTIIINDINLNYYNIGSFDNIYLLDNNYFINRYPLIYNYQDIILKEDIIGNITNVKNIIYDQSNNVIFKNNSIPVYDIVEKSYIINKINNIRDYESLFYFDLSGIQINCEDEKLIELNLYDTNTSQIFLRPLIIKYKDPNISYPNIVISWSYNNLIYNNSFIFLNSIPKPNISFCTLTITYNLTINSIQILQPCINIASNSNFTINNISFNDTNGIKINIPFKIKLLINNLFPVYIWVYYSNNFINYTTNSITEPIYLNENNYTLFSINNIEYNGSLPNLLIKKNNILQLNKTLYFNYIPRRFINKYYNTSIYSNTLNYKIINYNFNINRKFLANLYLFDSINIIDFNESYIKLTSDGKKILLQSTYLIILNDTYIYTVIINNDSEGVYIDTTLFKLNKNYKIAIYYSYAIIVPIQNNIIIKKDDNSIYKIIKYEYNDFMINEIIAIDNTIFQILGINTITNYYEMLRLSDDRIQSSSYPEYISWGVPNDKPLLVYPTIIYGEPLIYTLDTYNLTIGDYYLINGIFKNKLDINLEYDIFSYKKKGTYIRIYVINGRFYYLNELDNLNQYDTLIINSQLYHIKTILNRQIFFKENLFLVDGYYDIYYPYQPFNYAYVTLDSNSNIASSSININIYDFVEIDNIFYSVNKIPMNYNNNTYYTRVANIQKTKIYFENPLYLTEYISKSIGLDTNPVIYVKATILDSYSIDLNENRILDLYFYYNQPIKIGSIINFISSIIYRDTTIIVYVVNPIDLNITNIDVYIAPLYLHQNKYYSIYEINNFRSPVIDISNNITEYVITPITYSNVNNKVQIQILNSVIAVNINSSNINITDNNLHYYFVDNYTQIDSNYNIVSPSLEISSFHLILEITIQKDYIIHLVKIVYPHNLYFFYDIVNTNSTYYLDKIYKIILNFTDYSFIFDNIFVYKKKNMLSKIDSVDIWYKYPIQSSGIPFYVNNQFRLQILNANVFVNQNIYLYENATEYYNVTKIGSYFYLVSDTYLGNNINFFYLKNTNYLKSSNPINKTYKSYLTNHNDYRISNYLYNNINTEKLIISVNVILDNVGDTYKYKIYRLDNQPYLLNPTKKYFIGNKFLEIIEDYVYNNDTYIITNNIIPNVNNNQTLLYSSIDIITLKFDQQNLFKTVPEILSKINLANNIFPYMILNKIKSWDTWSILSASNITNIQNLLNKGNIYVHNNNIYHDTSNVYFTNDEVNNLSNLLLFINQNNNEIVKINTQVFFLNKLLIQLNNWINDSTFWFNVTGHINEYLLNLNINAIFNNYCLVFSDEDISSNIYFDLSNPYIKRKYTLNNQYILVNNNLITRNTDLISNEISLIINNQLNNSSYGIELNDLLYNLYLIGENYKNIVNQIYLTEDKQYYYFNSVKLFINHIWNNYRNNSLKLINKSFNSNLILNYTINPNNIQDIKYFTNNFEFKSSNIFSNNEEVYIKDYYLYSNYFINQNADYTLLSDPIYPYYINFQNDIVIPEVIYTINFLDLDIKSQLYDVKKYPIEMDFFSDTDLDINVKYSITGLTNYNLISNYLGQLYTIPIIDLDFNIVDSIIYKNTNVSIYNFDLSFVYIASLVDIQNNNFLELYKNVGLKLQNNNQLFFYQNNFNYINNNTYIKYNDIFYPLNIDFSGNYYINNILTLPTIVTIVILYNLHNININNNYIYQLTLNNDFINYNQYIDNPDNIIPINFYLNNEYIPDEIIFYSHNILLAKTNITIDISNISHYANLGENPPLEMVYLFKEELYLYTTTEKHALLDQSILYISDSSNYLLGEVGNYNNLDLTKGIQFILTKSYNNYEISPKKLYIVNSWTINDYIYDPNNENIIFNYPLSLIFNNSDQYKYQLNNKIINDIYINNNRLIINYELSVSGPFIFTQVYKSNSEIKIPKYNQVCNLQTIVPIQNSSDVYLLAYDSDGNNIGNYMYKITLQYDLVPFNILKLYLVSDSTIECSLVYWYGNNEIIISTSNPIDIKKYILNMNNYTYTIINIIFFQNSYQYGTFYYQDNINSFYLFFNSNINNLDFRNQINNTKYYVHSKLIDINFMNIFNPRSIERSNNMKIKNINNNQINQIIEKPNFQIYKIMKLINLFMGDQLVDTLNEDIFKINYYFYSDEERKNQSDKIFRIIENTYDWEFYIPLTFWFSHKPNLAIPIIALPYIDFYLKYEINNINTILTNDLTNSKFSINPELNIEIVLDSILLDTPERKMFGSHLHEYIIERFVIYPNNLIYNNTQTINIKYTNLVKDIFFISKPVYHQDLTYYENYLYDYDEKYNYYTNAYKEYLLFQKNTVYNNNNIIYVTDFVIFTNINIEISINKSMRIEVINNDVFFNNYELRFILFLMDKYLSNLILKTQIYRLKLYFIHIYKNNKIINQISPIQTLNIQSNGVDLVKQYDYTYYNIIIPYQKFLNNPPNGYYSYSFSLFPLEMQHSGHLNFSHLDNVVLKLTNNIINNEPFNLINIVKEYQILRIMSGQGSLDWFN